ncbi:MAG: hypothetical protein B1H04_03800 [Planctomycetales bacterium 4484_123]|nr:MAG: hypothetical protein B1H04_03800 [Planctomycetales bacterium 4484_123]
MTTALLISSAFLAGLLAAAPMGPVNMVAIRRGLIAGWTRTLWVSLGCVMLEATYILVGFWGGAQLMDRLPIGQIRTWVGLPGAAVILAIGLLILRKAVRNPRRVLAAARAERTRSNGASRLRDLLTGAGLTLINPAVLLYWLGAGAKLIEKGHVAPGSAAVWQGAAAATAGLSCWFLSISLLIRSRPDRVGPNFFRAVDAVCGAVLTVSGIALALTALT